MAGCQHATALFDAQCGTDLGFWSGIADLRGIIWRNKSRGKTLAEHWCRDYSAFRIDEDRRAFNDGVVF